MPPEHQKLSASKMCSHLFPSQSFRCLFYSPFPGYHHIFTRARKISGRLIILIVAQAVRRPVLIGIVLFGTKVTLVVLIVHVLSRLFGMMVGAFAVPRIHTYRTVSSGLLRARDRERQTLGLSKLVNFATDEAFWEKVRLDPSRCYRHAYPTRSSLAN